MGLLYILLQNGRFSQPQKVKFRLPVRAYTSSMDRFRLEETLQTACRNSVWFGFGDCLKIAFLGPRTTIFSSSSRQFWSIMFHLLQTSILLMPTSYILRTFSRFEFFRNSFWYSRNTLVKIVFCAIAIFRSNTLYEST